MKRASNYVLCGSFALFSGYSAVAFGQEPQERVFDCDFRVEVFDTSGRMEKASRAKALYNVDSARDTVREVIPPHESEVHYPIKKQGSGRVEFGKSSRVVIGATEISQTSSFIIEKFDRLFLFHGDVERRIERVINEETGRFRRDVETKTFYGSCAPR